MIEKMKNFFKEPVLTCTSCGIELAEGDQVTATFTIPSEKGMPVGPLHKVIHKHATIMLCENCE